MSRPYTRINLADVEDAAPAYGFGDRWEARVARTPLEAEQTGVTHFRLRPGKRCITKAMASRSTTPGSPRATEGR
jgi:hypothetical protein